MADIQWYPGHMTKSMRLIEENLKAVDAVVYVLDARAPLSSINPNFEALLKGKPVIYILNKHDLADPSVTAAWLEKFKSESRRAIELNAAASKSGGAVFSLIRTLCADKVAKYESKGAKATLKAMVIGVPNTGKSTLINMMCGRAKATAGNRPGVTRGKQWVRVTDYLELLDTPGTLYPKLSDQDIAMRLYLVGCIREEIVDTVDAALYLSNEIKTAYPGALEKRYSGEGDNVLETIARSRGYLVRGGEIDELRAAAALIDDYRKGRIGRLSLESPEKSI